MDNVINNQVSISKYEYEIYNEKMLDERQDFYIKINKGSVLPMEHPNYNEGRISIKIYDIDNYSIKIEGQDYNIKTIELINKIKQFVNDNFEDLVNISKAEDNMFLDSKAYEGGVAKTIEIKLGQLLIKINGQVRGEVGEYVGEFIESLSSIIINDNKNKCIPKEKKHPFEKILEKYKKESNDSLSKEDLEFNKYCKLYEEKFGKKAYIAEPGGTKEKTINAIKICLEKNQDLLDELLYPNWSNDKNNDVFY